MSPTDDTSAGSPEERVAAALRLFPAPPRAWVRAAQELPTVRRAIESLVERAERDAAAREAVLADLAAALEGEGVEPTPSACDALRRRLVS